MTHWHKGEDCQRSVNEFHLVAITKSGLDQTGVSQVTLSKRECPPLLGPASVALMQKRPPLALEYAHPLSLLICPVSPVAALSG